MGSMGLVVNLPARGGRSDALYRALRDAVTQGRVQAGEKLPASRTLAQDLGVARASVTAAYERLVAEGYLESRAGSGTFVTAEGVEPRAGAAGRRGAAAPRVVAVAGPAGLGRRSRARARLPPRSAGRVPLPLRRVAPPPGRGVAVARADGVGLRPGRAARSARGDRPLGGAGARRAGRPRPGRGHARHAARPRPGGASCWSRATRSPSRTRASRRRATCSPRTARGWCRCRSTARA